MAADLAANYVAVKINADHFPATAQQYGVTALPTTVITTPQGQLLDTMRGRVEAADYVARLNQVAAAAKQRGGAVYAQVPAGTAPPAAATPTAAQTPPVASQPPMAGMQPSTSAGRRLAPIRSRRQPAASLRAAIRGLPTTVTPISSGAARRPRPRRSPSRRRRCRDRLACNRRPTTVPPAATQPCRRSRRRPGISAVAAACDSGAAGGQSPVRPTRRPMAACRSNSRQPPPGNPALPPPAGSPTPQLPTINPPLGLDGYCPVALAEKQQWVLGDRRWGAIHRGRTYLFAGPEEQRRFFTDPDRYAPAVSGNDVVLATEQGQAVPGMREHGVFFGNRVYLFSSEATLEKFARNPSLYANQAMGAVRTGAYAGQSLQ